MIQAPGPLARVGNLMVIRALSLRAMGRTQVIEIRRPENRVIVGWPDEVAAVLRAYERRGHLLTGPRQIASTVRHLPDGRVGCTVTLMMPQSAPPPARLWRGIANALAATVLALVAFYALGVLLVALVGPVVLATVLVVLTALVWVVLSIRRQHACRGAHCASCPAGDRAQ